MENVEKQIVLTEEQSEKFERISGLIKAADGKYGDLLADYNDWEEVGVGIANDFGEAGRDLFAAVSLAFSRIGNDAAMMHYDFCLKMSGSRSDLGSDVLEQIAAEAGLTVQMSEGGRCEEEVSRVESMPEWIYDQLPELLREPVMYFAPGAKREMMMLASIATYSAALPMFYGLYGGKKQSANLYYFVAGAASSGKGPMESCLGLVGMVDEQERLRHANDMARYEREEVSYRSQAKKDPSLRPPKKPAERMLIMAANTSATSLYQRLAENNLGLLLLDSEGDTMNQAFKNDQTNYSDGLRKCFHNEMISYSRRTNDEFVQCRHSKLSVVLSGTVGQMLTLFPSAENGLFSRFMFYTLEGSEEWVDPLPDEDKGSLDDVFGGVGRKFCRLYNRLMGERLMYKFRMTESQRGEFNARFGKWKPSMRKIYTKDFDACVHRAGLMFYRIAMILTALRCEESGAFSLPVLSVRVQEPQICFDGGPMVRGMVEGEYDEAYREIFCSDMDFRITMEIMEKVILHIAKAFQMLPRESACVAERMNERYGQWYESLGREFTTQEALEMGKLSNIGRTKVMEILKGNAEKGVIEKVERGRYVKI